MKRTKKLLSLLTALAITASSFAAMVIPASADVNDPAAPEWQIGRDGSAAATTDTVTQGGVQNALKINDKNVYAAINEVSTDTVEFKTDVYLDPTVQKNFRIVLQNEAAEMYDTETAFAQVAFNNGGKVYTGPDLGDAGTELFTHSTAGWYTFDITLDYSQKTTDQFITLKVTDALGTVQGTETKMAAIDGKDTTLKAIRLIRSAAPVYFANYTVTPGSVLAPVTTPSTDPGGDGGDDGGDFSYEQDFDDLTQPSELGWTLSGDTPATLEADSNGGKYLRLKHNGTANSRGSYGLFGDLPAGTEYILDFDLALDSNTDQTSQFSILGADYKFYNDQPNDGLNTGYVFDMGAGNTTVWNLNKTDKTVDLPRGEFFHYQIMVNDKYTFVTITKSDGTKLLDKEPLQINGGGGLKGFAWRSGRKNSVLSIDNIVLRPPTENEIPDTKFYTATVKTNRYATIKYTTTLDDVKAAEKTVFADVNGNITIPMLNEGTVIDYTISKEGYTTADDQATASGKTTMDSDKTIEAELTKLAADIGVESDDLLYYENAFGYATNKLDIDKTNRMCDTALGEIDLAENQTYEIQFDVDIPAAERTQITIAFFGTTPGNNTDKNDLFGIQGYADGLFAFSDLKPASSSSISQGWNQGCQGLFTAGEKVADTYVGKYKVDMVVNNNTKKVTVKIGDNAAKTIPFTKDASKITYLRVGKAETQTGLSIDNLIVKKPDPNYVGVSGDSKFAKIKGKEVTRDYTAEALVVVDGESFEWSIANKSAEGGVAGVSIDQTGKVTVTNDAVPGTYVITAASKVGEVTSSTKVGTYEIEIADYQAITLIADGPKAYMNTADDTGKYEIVSAKDGCDDEVKDDMPAPVWTSSKTDVATINSATGELTVVGKGETTITATVTNDTKVSKVEIPVVVDNFYITDDVADNAASTEIDLAADKIVKADKYVVTTAKEDGTLVNQEVIDLNATKTTAEEAGVKITATYTGNALTSVEAPETVAAGDEIEEAAAGTKVFFWKSLASMEPAKTKTEKIYTGTKVNIDTTDAAKYEVAPVFETTMNTEVAVPADRYNITVTANNGGRTDVFVNNQMIINNLNQGCDSWDVTRTIPATADYEVGDVVIPEGYAKFVYQDHTGDSVNNIAFVKAPSIVTRAKRMYVVGDSLVAKYYGDASKPEWTNLVRTGWGDVLQDYVKDVKVTNLGNSGAWAAGMVNDAFTNIAQSAQKGDIVVWEFGYNDDGHGGDTPMLAAAAQGKQICDDLGLDLYIVTPNASEHDYKADVKSSAAMRTWATENSVDLIDLSAISYKFFTEHYGTMSADDRTPFMQKYYSNAKDSLHSTYNAANAFAAIVAQNLPTELQNTEHTFTIDDGTETPITVGVGKMPTLEAASGSGE